MPEMGIGKFPNVKTDEIYFDRENLDIVLKRLAANTLGLNTGDYFAADRLYVDAANLSHYIYRYSEAYGGLNGAWRVNGILAMALNRIINLGAPTSDNDAARKIYVDDAIDADILTHATDIDAHHLPYFNTAYIGKGYNTLPSYGYAGLVVTANRLYAYLLVLQRPMTFSDILANVAAQAGQKLRFGVYDANADLTPKSLVKDYGEITLSGTGFLGIASSLSLAKPGYYYCAVVSDGAPTLNYLTIGMSPLGNSYGDLRRHNSGFYGAHTYGALPATFPSPTIHTEIPLLMLEPSSMD